tara:strand:- start:608 stop:1351 length:744 start_codon:yes stop_codon:yes gene_type:complete
MYKLKYLKYKKKYLNLKNNLKGGNNDLQQNDIFRALEMGDINEIQTLINNNPNQINQQNDLGQTPIFIFLRSFRNYLNDAENILTLLITRDADVNLLDNERVTTLIQFVLSVLHDEELTRDLTQDQVNRNLDLSERLRIYNNILNRLIINIPNINRSSTISHLDNSRRSVFTLLNGNGYIGEYYTDFFNRMIGQHQQQQQQQAQQPLRPLEPLLQNNRARVLRPEELQQFGRLARIVNMDEDQERES